MTEKKQTIKRRLEGIVVSDKMSKTVVVEVERFKRHPLYHKIMRISKRFKAHDEKNECKVGDRVLIEQTRPLSKEKRWKVIKIIHRKEENNGIENENLDQEKDESILNNSEQ
ncbi:MAG: 30S ribosomal protein S17 [Minisyncoccia bacterium]